MTQINGRIVSFVRSKWNTADSFHLNTCLARGNEPLVCVLDLLISLVCHDKVFQLDSLKADASKDSSYLYRRESGRSC